MPIRLHIVIFFLLLATLSFAQKINTDSLELALPTLEKEEKIDALMLLFEIFKQKDSKKAFEYGLLALELNNEENDELREAELLNKIANLYKRIGDFNKAFDFAFQSLEIVEQLNIPAKIAAYKNNIGLIYFRLTDYEKALKFFFDALVLKEELKKESSLSKTLHNIGMVYGRLHQYSNALEYYDRALRIKQKLGKKKTISLTLNNMGIIYKELEEYEKALELHFQSLELKQKIGYQNGIAVSYNNIGELYFLMEDYNKALSYLYKSLKLRTTEVEDKEGKTITLLILGKTYLALENYKQAIQLYQKGLLEAQEVNSLSLQSRMYGNLALAYAAMENFEQAWAFGKKYSEVNDSLLNEATIRHISDIQLNYEILKQNEKIAQLEEESILSKELIQQQQYFLIASIIAFLLLVALLTTLYNRFISKRKVLALLESKNKAINDQNSLLSRSNQELQQFAYVVSHDLKAPLRAISTLSTFLEEDMGTRMNEADKETIQLLKGRVHRMEGLIKGIFEYSKIGRVHTGKELVSLSPLLQEIMESSKSWNGKVVSYTCSNHFPTLVANPTLVHQVFQNLISNAVKYNDKPVCEIMINYKPLESHHQFTIRDNGPGIPKRYHEKIFKIFQTLQPKDEIESTGIGLAIVEKIIKEQGKGKIWLESEEGRSTSFYFTWEMGKR